MSDRKIKNLFDSFEEKGFRISDEQKAAMIERFDNIRDYEPRIGIFGKTGVGKSSLCNALFGEKICEISDVEACTRSPQNVMMQLSGKGKNMTLIDVPGVGESRDRDIEYGKLYAKLLPELDIVLWLLKGDDRAFSSDEQFFKSMVKPHLEQGKPVFFILNQVDMIMPHREWNDDEHEPGPNQLVNIEKKRRMVADFFGIPISKVIAVSAYENYNLVNLVDEIIFALPLAKKITVLTSVPEEYLSEEAQEDIEDAYEETFGEKLEDLWEDFLYSPIGDKLVDTIIDIGEAGERFLDGISSFFGKFLGD